jgi:pyrroline-5-carboxylate reductase
VYSLRDEEMMHVFTAGVCLPAAILGARGTDTNPEIGKIFQTYPHIAELYPWASSVIPAIGSDCEREMYIAGMSTKGGITEAIVSSIRSGAAFSRAFDAGIERSREMSARAVGAYPESPVSDTMIR